MSEREPKNDSGVVVSENQSRFFMGIGMDIPVNTYVPLSARHLQVMQGRVEGLTYDELAKRLSLTVPTIQTYVLQLTAIGEGFATGSNGFEAIVSFGVGIGKVSASKVIPNSGVDLDASEAAILGLMVQGYDNHEIFRTLDIGKMRLGLHMKKLYKKLGLDMPYRRKSVPAVAIAVDLLKQRFENSEAQA